MAHEPQPVGMWQLCHNRIITLLFVVRWVKSVAALSVALWKWNLFILHGVFGQLDCCLALPRKATNTSLWRGGGLGVILGFRFLFVVFAERRRDVTARRMELDAGTEDKETLESFSVVYPICHLPLHFPSRFPSMWCHHTSDHPMGKTMRRSATPF